MRLAQPVPAKAGISSHQRDVLLRKYSEHAHQYNACILDALCARVHLPSRALSFYPCSPILNTRRSPSAHLTLRATLPAHRALRVASRAVHPSHSIQSISYSITRLYFALRRVCSFAISSPFSPPPKESNFVFFLFSFILVYLRLFAFTSFYLQRTSPGG
jgi:hypothetical protein